MPELGGTRRSLSVGGPQIAKLRTMPTMMRNKAKAGIDKVARGARRATDELADAADKNRRPSDRAATKVKAAAERAGDKVKQAGRAVKDAGRRAKAKARRATR
jgi:hypothetical protein